MEIANLRENLLVQTPKNEVLKVSTIYPRYVTAQVVYPNPARTTVRAYLPEEIEKWREPSDAIISRYEIAWGYR